MSTPKRIRRVTKKKIDVKLEPWIALVFTTVALALVPWTIYLAITLPKRHLVLNWDVTWVVLDIAIMLTILITGFLATIRSRWIIISVTTMSSFLLVDAWFDIQTSRTGRELMESIVLAIFVEIPFSILGYVIAYRIINRNVD